MLPVTVEPQSAQLNRPPNYSSKLSRHEVEGRHQGRRVAVEHALVLHPSFIAIHTHLRPALHTCPGNSTAAAAGLNGHKTQGPLLNSPPHTDRPTDCRGPSWLVASTHHTQKTARKSRSAGEPNPTASFFTAELQRTPATADRKASG